MEYQIGEVNIKFSHKKYIVEKNCSNGSVPLCCHFSKMINVCKQMGKIKTIF